MPCLPRRIRAAKDSDSQTLCTPIPTTIVPAVRTLDTMKTMGQMVPGPWRKRLAVRPVMDPAHSAVAAAHDGRLLLDGTNAARRSSVPRVHATPVPEFSHHPVHACIA